MVFNGPTPAAWIGHHETGDKVEMRPTVDTGLAEASRPTPSSDTSRSTDAGKRRDSAVAAAAGDRDDVTSSENDVTTRPKRTIIPPARYRE